MPILESPLGELVITLQGDGISGLYTPNHREQIVANGQENPALFSEVQRQLDAYFAGDLRIFDLPLSPNGTEFQQTVWQELLKIPYGETISYGQLATRLGDPNLSRAVGAANGQNPISIIVPCHRVIGASGKLTGYAGGLETKQWLLDHESGGNLFS
jgi:methylated-DNA-[protein]-cysteine S-methyltransferase